MWRLCVPHPHYHPDAKVPRATALQLPSQTPAEVLSCLITILGLSWVVLSPWPSRPYSPRPQVYNSPLDVRAALCELPQAMSRMRLVFRASISRGLSQFLAWEEVTG